MVSKCALNNICNTGWKSQCYIDSEGTLAASINLATVEVGNSSLGFIRLPKRNLMTENKLNVSLLHRLP